MLRRIVAFPGIPMTIDMDRGPAKKILETAAKEGSPVFLVCQKNPLEDVTELDDVYTVGVITKIKQVVKTQSGLFRAIIEPERRAVLTGFGDEKLQTANILEKLVIETAAARDWEHHRGVCEIRAEIFQGILAAFRHDTRFGRGLRLRGGKFDSGAGRQTKDFGGILSMRPRGKAHRYAGGGKERYGRARPHQTRG